MELLINSGTTLHFVGPSFSRPSLFSTSLPISNSVLSVKKTNFPFLRKHSSSSSSSSSSSYLRHSRTQLTVSATSVALNAEKDRLPADIEVTETKEPHSRVRLSVKVPPTVCQDCYKRILREFEKQAKVPGFRPGKKVPEYILIDYIGKQNVQKAAIESILKRTLSHAMSSVQDRALQDSVRILTKFSEMEAAFSPLNVLGYEVAVDVAPEVKWISENGYKNLKIIVEIDNEINAERVFEVELRRRHKALGSLRIVTDRGLQIGDVAVLDIFATTIKQDVSDGEKIPSTERKGFHLDMDESDYLLPGFVDSIIGIQAGEIKSFPYMFPESWNQENLRGVQAQFTVECKEIFYRDLPELDDSVADKLLPGCSTLSQVKESILQRCREMEQTAREQAADNAILDQLCKIIKVDIPRSLFEEQGRQLYGATLLQLQASRKIDEQQLVSLSSEKSVNEYLESQRENINNIIKQRVAVGAIFKHEKLQYSTEELVKEVENSVAEFKQNNQEYDEERIKEQVQEILEGAKALEWLREHADIQYVTK